MTVEWQNTPRYAGIIAAAVLVVRGPDGAPTFVRQKDGPFAGTWMLPGGGIEVGERARDAAIRETAEETGIEVPPDAVRAIGTYEILSTWPEQRPYHVLMSAFVAEGSYRLPPGFVGDNGGGLAQIPPGGTRLLSTDRHILTDSGLLDDQPAVLRAALADDRLTIGALGRR